MCSQATQPDIKAGMERFGNDILHKRYPMAYLALPSAYQNDSCLEFYEDCNGNLVAAPKDDQKAILGDKEWLWCPLSMTWAEIGE